MRQCTIFLIFCLALRAALDKQDNPMHESGCCSSDIIEFTQGPGETVFVPGGWWHSVLNVSDTVAVTQNFCSRTNFLKVWKETRSGRKKMAVRWLKLLIDHYPELAELAQRANVEDGYVMYDEKKKLKEERMRVKEEEKKEKMKMKMQKNGNTSKSGDSPSTPHSPTVVESSKEHEASKSMHEKAKRSESSKHMSRAKVAKREEKRQKRSIAAVTSDESSSEASYSSTEDARLKVQKFRM